MDEEIRQKMLSRIRRENIIKVGTYDFKQKSRQIFQTDPTSEFALFYDVPEDKDLQVEDSEDNNIMSSESLATQILSNNFRTGLSQAEVDSLLMGMV